MSLVDSKIVLDDDADRVDECYSFVDNKGVLYESGFYFIYYSRETNLNV
jgi:hypothetical protein